MALSDLVVDLIMNTSNFEAGCTSAINSVSALKAGIEGAGGVADALGVTAAAGFTAFGAVADIAVGAIASISTELIGFSKNAAFLPTIEEGFNRISISAGKSGETMLKELTAASGGMISAADMMTNFNQAAMLISPTIATELPTAMGYLQKVSMSTGTSMEYLMNSLVVGVGRASPRILDNMGIQIKATEAYDAYAESIGKTVSQLTKAEQSEAIWRMTLEKLEQNTRNIPDVQDSAAASIQRFQAAIENLKNEMGVAFLPTLADFTETFTDLAVSLSPLAITIATGFGKLFTSLLDVITPVIPIITKFAKGLTLVMGLFGEGKIEQGMSILTTIIGNLGKRLAPVLEDIIEFGSSLIFGIVRGVAEALPSLMDTLNDILPMILGVLEEIIPGALDVGLDLIINLANGIAQGLPNIINSAGKIVLNIMQTLADKVPDLMKAGTNILKAIAQGLKDTIPELVGRAPGIIVDFVKGITENLGDLLTAGIEILAAVVDGVILAIPALLEQAPVIISLLLTAFIDSASLLLTAGVEIIVAILEGITENKDQIIEGGIRIVEALIDGIIGSIDLITEVIVELIPILVRAIVDSLPAFIDAGIQITAAILEGLLSVEVVTAVTELITGIIITFGEQGQVLFDSGVLLIGYLISGIESALPAVDAAAMTALETALNGIHPGAVDFFLAGAEWLTNLNNGINSKLQDVHNLAVEVVTGTVQALKDGVGKWAAAGADMVAGLASGIRGGLSSVVSAAVDVAAAAINAALGALGINSPSKVFMEIGEGINEGLALGIKQSMYLPEREVAYDFDKLEDQMPEYKHIEYNLNMPTTANAGDVKMAFELMEAWNT